MASNTQSDALGGPPAVAEHQGPQTTPTATRITEHRELRGDDGPVRLWTVNEFDGGQRVMLTAATLGTAFSVHFDAQQWAAFQSLVVGERP